LRCLDDCKSGARLATKQKIEGVQCCGGGAENAGVENVAPECTGGTVENSMRY